MIDKWPILSTITFLPLFGAFLISMIDDISESDHQNVRNVAFLTTFFVFILSLFIWISFNASNPHFQMEEKFFWINNGISYHLGIDGISILFVVIASFLMMVSVLSSWRNIKKNLKNYMIAFLILETMIIGSFCSLNIMLFYIFFEGSLIPLFIIIGVWGGKNRVYSAFKFFFYTLLGSLLMLIAVMVIYEKTGTLDIPTLYHYRFPEKTQFWLWLAFFASFSIKIPMWPTHTWLPDAHVEAPTAGSVILSGILLKLGSYGFLRFSIPMFPMASYKFSLFIFLLSLISIIYASFIALVQNDIKKIIAYSSIAHMGYVTMGIFTVNPQGVEGSIFQMLSHAIVSPALFLCAGVLYDRLHTRKVISFGGLAKNMPKYSTIFFIFTIANIGVPGTTGFIGEFLTLIGVFRVNNWIAIFSAFGIVLSASYGLYLYRRVAFGTLNKEKLKGLIDLSLREKLILYPMSILTIVLGIYPSIILNTIHPTTNLLINNYNKSLIYMI